MDLVTTILGLMLVLVPVIGKFIERKLQNAGKTGQAESVKKIIDIFDTGNDNADAPETMEEIPVDIPAGIPAEISETVPVPQIQVVPQISVMPDTVAVHETGRSVSLQDGRTLSGDKSEDGMQSGRKIDLRNLVIYSEIMRPKFES